MVVVELEVEQAAELEVEVGIGVEADEAVDKRGQLSVIPALGGQVKR